MITWIDLDGDLCASMGSIVADVTRSDRDGTWSACFNGRMIGGVFNTRQNAADAVQAHVNTL